MTQIELNKVVFRRTGAIEAQTPLDTAVFATQAEIDAGTDKVVCQNGMILAVTPGGKIVCAKDAPAGSVYGVNYSTEHMYDERKNALKDFYLAADSFYPRLGYFAKGDVWTTDAITNLNEIGTKKFVAFGEKGMSELVGEDKAEDAYAVVVESTTMPDGTKAAKIRVI